MADFLHKYKSNGQDFYTVTDSPQKPTGTVIRLTPADWMGYGTGAGRAVAIRSLSSLDFKKEVEEKDTELKAKKYSSITEDIKKFANNFSKE